MFHLYRRVSSFIHLHSSNSFHGLVTYSGPYLARTRVSMSPSPPSDESNALIHLWYWGLWTPESRNRLSHSLHKLDFGEGGSGWSSPAPTCFIHFLFSMISPVHLDHSLLRQFNQQTSHPEHFARSQPLLGIPWNLSYF